MARDKIERILRFIRVTQKAARLTEDFSPGSRRIPLHHKDAYGEVESAPFFFVKAEAYDIQANDWGTLSRPSIYIYLFIFSHSYQKPWPSIVPSHSLPFFRSR